MNDERPETWPLLPSHSSYTLNGLAAALVDVIREEVGGDVSPRTLMKANGLAMAVELFSQEVAHFFGAQMGDDHDQLEAIQDRYITKRNG